MIALELLATGKLQGQGPAAVPAQAFTTTSQLQKAYGFPGGMLEMDSEFKRAAAGVRGGRP